MYKTQMTKQERESRSKLKPYISYRELLKGSLSIRKQKCGKPNCKCAKTSYRHICFYLARRKEGKIEQLFIPKKAEPIILPSNAPGLQLLQYLRDEAHRFAISYYAKVHQRKTFASALDSIPGIGPKRKSALLRRFGSLQGIREASEDDLIAATGMTGGQVKKIKEYL